MDASEEQSRARAGRAIRDLGHAFVGHDVPPELIDEMAATLAALTERLGSGPERSRDPGAFGDRWAEEMPQGRVPTAYGDRPISGQASPWGLDLDVHRHGDEIDARVTLRAAHEGAPHRAHGGVVAALFDDVFGFVLGVIEQAAFTGELKVRYEQGTPLHRPLSCRARAIGAEGRKILMTGELVDLTDGGVIARGTAVFISVDRHMYAASSAELPAPPDEDRSTA
jgi:acyl-coenzyme A thioesterase PaaI-like protein